MANPLGSPGGFGRRVVHSPALKLARVLERRRLLVDSALEVIRERQQISDTLNETRSLVQGILDHFSPTNTVRDFMLFIMLGHTREVVGDAEYRALMLAAARRGLPLIMIPTAELLVDVVESKSFTEGAATLFEAKDDIVERCRIMLTGQMPREFASAPSNTLTSVHPIAVAAVEMFMEGQYVGAQAAATAVLDTLLAKVLGGQMDYLGRTDHWGRNKKYQQTQILKLLDIIEKESSSADANHALALKLIIPPATRAFQPTRQEDMTEYNRNATIHLASKNQYTPTNALIAVMHMSAVVVLMRCIGPEAIPPTPAGSS